MIALDTNILIRFLVNDDKTQASIVRKRLKQAERKEETLFISNPVILELVWVLDSVYKFNRSDILNALEALLFLPIIFFENHDLLNLFIREGRHSKIELSDLLIGLVANVNAVSTTLTFDKKAAHHDLFTLIT